MLRVLDIKLFLSSKCPKSYLIPKKSSEYIGRCRTVTKEAAVSVAGHRTVSWVPLACQLQSVGLLRAASPARPGRSLGSPADPHAVHSSSPSLTMEDPEF